MFDSSVYLHNYSWQEVCESISTNGSSVHLCHKRFVTVTSHETLDISDQKLIDCSFSSSLRLTKTILLRFTYISCRLPCKWPVIRKAFPCHEDSKWRPGNCIAPHALLLRFPKMALYYTHDISMSSKKYLTRIHATRHEHLYIYISPFKVWNKHMLGFIFNWNRWCEYNGSIATIYCFALVSRLTMIIIC